MPAFVKVNFTKPLTIKKGNNNDLATRFQISNTSSAPPNPSLVILSAQIQGNSVLLELQNDEVPKPGDLMTIAYTKPTDEVGALVDASTGYDVENLVSVSSTTLNNAIANTPLPEVIQGVVEHETPNKIQISFTQGRTMQTNSVPNDGTAGFGFTPSTTNSGGSFVTTSWDYANTSPDFPGGLNTILTLNNDVGEIQNGMDVNLSINGDSLLDQFDLSVNQTSFQVTNNVKQVILDNAYISNNDPSACIMYFKVNDSSGVDMSVINVNEVDCAGIYKIRMGEETPIDISGVEDISFSLIECQQRGIPSKYADVNGIMFRLDAYPFKYQSNVKVFWDTPSLLGENNLNNEKILADKFGNKVFESGYDPKADITDISYIPITSNLIKGIAIKDQEGSLVVDESGNDFAYNSILSFVNATDGADISGTLIGTNAGDFEYTNQTTGQSFLADNIHQLSDPSRVMIGVNLSTINFDKVINQGDVVTLSYNNTNWPSTISDKFGNYMLPQSNLNVTNNMDLSGNIESGEHGIQLFNDGTGFNHIDLTYDVDLSLNRSDGMITGGDGFTLTVDDPTGVQITEVKEVNPGSNEVEIILNKSLFKTSNATLSYNNTTSTIRTTYGIKLNNESARTLPTSTIPDIGGIATYGSISGKYNEFGIIDLSFNPPVNNLGDGLGFQYSVGYGSTISDLSTNGFVDISASNVSLNSDNSIRLDTKFNNSGGPRGFSKHMTSGGQYHITVKYNGSTNKPSGVIGYLEPFQISIADVSNSILDPSCNPDQSIKQTAIVQAGEPNVLYVAFQQPAYVELEPGAPLEIQFFDISSIIFSSTDNPYFQYNDGTTLHNSTSITSKTGLAIGGHTNDTQWIKATFAVDISSTDLSLNLVEGYGIRDQNGGLLDSFQDMDINSQVNWIELENDANFETGGTTNYPFIAYNNNNYNKIYIKWNPNFSDFDSTPLSSYTLQYDVTNEGEETSTTVTKNPVGQGWVNETTTPGNELTLVLSFNENINPTGSSNHQLKYTKPVGVQSTGRWGGLKLGNFPKKWLRSFDFKTVNIQSPPPAPTMTISAVNSTNTVVNSGDSTSDETLTLTFTSSITTSDFVSSDITVTNGVISNFSGSGTTYTATFTPDGNGSCTIEVLANAYTSAGVGNTASSTFSWTKTSPSSDASLLSMSVTTAEPTKLMFTFSEAVSEPPGNFTEEELPDDGIIKFANNLPAPQPFIITMDEEKNGQTSRPSWTGNFTAENSDNGVPPRATKWYLTSSGGETQFDTSFNVVIDNTNSSATTSSGGGIQSTTSPIYVTNNVITPYYTKNWNTGITDVSSSWIDHKEPNSVYMWFRDSSSNDLIRDLTDNSSTINNYVNRYKFISQDTLEHPHDTPINIIDVSSISFQTLDDEDYRNPMGRDIDVVKFDLSRNTADISSVLNPYSFTSHDKIYMWWSVYNAADASRLKDNSGNEIWDSSANKTGFITNDTDATVDISGDVIGDTTRDYALDWMGMSPDFAGLEINNQIRDIRMVSGSVEGTNIAADAQSIILRFQTDVSFAKVLGHAYTAGNPVPDIWTVNDISASDWVIEISGNSAASNNTWVDISNVFGAENGVTRPLSMSGFPIKTQYSGGETGVDISENAIAFDLYDAFNTDLTSPAINVGDDVRIKLKDMNNKSIGRNYIDFSGNKLTPAGVAAGSSDGWFYLTNNLGIFGGVPGGGF